MEGRGYFNVLLEILPYLYLIIYCPIKLLKNVLFFSITNFMARLHYTGKDFVPTQIRCALCSVNSRKQQCSVFRGTKTQPIRDTSLKALRFTNEAVL